MMDTDDCEMSDKGADGDSGIENMETEDTVSAPIMQSAEPIIPIETEIKTVLSRVLNSSWAEYCEGHVVVKNTARMYMENVYDNDNVDDLVSEVIMEVIEMYISSALVRESSRQDSAEDLYMMPLKKQKQNCQDDENKIEENSSQKSNEEKAVAIINYLSMCFQRSCIEISSRKVKSMMEKAIQAVQNQIFKYSVLVLTQQFDPLFEGDAPKKSPLLPLMYEKTISDDYLLHLISDTYANDLEAFNQIFNSVLNDLFLDMQQACSNINIQSEPLELLKELVDIKLLPNCNERPICKLIVNHSNFLPRLCSEVPAREISKVTFLAPFLGISIFADENPKFVEHNFKDTSSSNQEGFQKMFATTVQNRLDSTRTTLHQIFVTLITNIESRQKTLQYLAEILKINEKRIQYNADERNLAKDGFMLNFMSVLQHLAVKIKLDKVDILYPYHPDSLIHMRDDTKLRFTSQEFTDWLAELSEYFLFNNLNR